MWLPKLMQSPLPAAGECRSLQAATRLPRARGLPSLHLFSLSPLHHVLPWQGHVDLLSCRWLSAAGLAAAWAHTRCLARVRSRAQHPAPNLAWAPPDTPHPWPPHLQPLPAGCLHGCCHLVGCIPSLFFWPSAGAYSPQLLAGTTWQGGRCWAVLLLRFISGQSPSVRVGGGSHALGYCLCTTLCPVFTLSCSGRGVSPWKSTFGEVATWACAMLGASRRVGAQTSSHGQGALDQAG